MKILNVVIAGLTLTFLSGCSCVDTQKQSKKEAEENLEKDEIAYIDSKHFFHEVKEARAIIRPINQSGVKGEVVFKKVSEGIQIVADISGLKTGLHGFHIHEFGDCGGEGGAATGGHFNPFHAKHGSPDDKIRHVGDLGNVEADKEGNAHYERIDKMISFKGETSILGRSIVVHSDPDDFVTQPTGNAGVKLGCGIIEPEELN